MEQFSIILISLLGLWIGTDLVVKNSVKIAKSYGVSEFFIGLTILAFGTDLPELTIAIEGGISNLKGIENSDLILGNAIGSAITQISFILGVTALFHYITIGKKQLKEFSIELISSCIFYF